MLHEQSLSHNNNCINEAFEYVCVCDALESLLNKMTWFSFSYYSQYKLRWSV